MRRLQLQQRLIIWCERSVTHFASAWMVGIGGGAPSTEHDIRLGDIVVSRRGGSYGGVVQHDMAKICKMAKFHSWVAYIARLNPCWTRWFRSGRLNHMMIRCLKILHIGLLSQIIACSWFYILFSTFYFPRRFVASNSPCGQSIIEQKWDFL